MKLNRNDLYFILNESVRKCLIEITVKDAYSSYYSDIPEDEYLQIIHTLQGDNEILDPEMRNVMKLCRKDKQTMLNNLEPFKDAFMLWKRAKDRSMLPPDMCDLNWYQSVEQFIGIISRLNRAEIEKRTKGELSRDIKAAKDNIDIVYQDEDWFVLVPKSYEASCHWGSETSWCTATRESDHHYKTYTKHGDKLYININKKTKEKYQFSFPYHEFHDQDNYEIDCPVLDTIGASEGMMEFYRNVSDIDEKSYNLLFNWKINFDESGWIEVVDDLEVLPVKVDGRYQFFNKNYQPIEDISFEYIDEIKSDIGIAIVSNDRKMYLYSFLQYKHKGKGLLPNEYDEISEFYPFMGFMDRNPLYHFAIVENDGKYNVINGLGELVSENWFDEIDDSEAMWHKKFIARIGDKEYTINKQGNVTENNYDEI